jgi:hypothetical protein
VPYSEFGLGHAQTAETRTPVMTRSSPPMRSPIRMMFLPLMPALNLAHRQLDVQFNSSSDQVADGFTKSLPESKLEVFRHNLNLVKL